MNKPKNINKTDILLREKMLDEKEKELDAAIQEYRKLIAQAKELKQNYLDTLKILNDNKKKYEAEMQAQLQRIKNQK